MKTREKAHKWWFYLYQLVGSVLNDEQQEGTQVRTSSDQNIFSFLVDLSFYV